MTAKELIDGMRKDGHHMQLDGEKLLFTAKRGSAKEVKRTALELLRKYKQDVIAYLVSEERYEAPAGQLAPCGALHCAGCYEVGPNIHIHPPKSGYNYERR